MRDKYAQRFRHVLVDEFQDTNLAQFTLIKHLASFNRNIFCVGDPDQSIYAWRGADYRNIHRFEQDFPDAQTILLEQNYRSHQNILDVATGVINRARNRRKKILFLSLGSCLHPTRTEDGGRAGLTMIFHSGRRGSRRACHCISLLES